MVLEKRRFNFTSPSKVGKRRRLSRTSSAIGKNTKAKASKIATFSTIFSSPVSSYYVLSSVEQSYVEFAIKYDRNPVSQVLPEESKDFAPDMALV
jgi:hypothetical protein